MPFALIAAIVAALVGGTTSVLQAQEQRKQANKAKDSAKEAAEIQAKQLKARNAAEANQRLREQHAIRGRALAVAADSGFDVGSDDFSTAIGQIDENAGLNLDTLDQNLYRDLQLLDSNLAAAMDRLNASKPDVFTSGLLGGFQMGATGLALGGGINKLFTEAPSAGIAGGSSFNQITDNLAPMGTAFA